MNSVDMAVIAQEVVALYGNAAPWSRALNSENQETERLAKHFGDDPGRVLAAIRAHAREHPAQAPKPAEIHARIRADRGVGNQGLRNALDCEHPRPLAIIDERRQGEEPLDPLSTGHAVGTRVGLCRYCYTEIIFEPGRLLTVTEIEERKARIDV